ncbi:unnamed protein product [Pleuronectes platessa]|uniref:Uncharacterized protein n=1 Tax=Pleuronectes platessa TaxID=8262 RepID=A0A9N7YXM2_PLEPL|nr:unnamed protein product [Pleuronectes platessa]
MHGGGDQEVQRYSSGATWAGVTPQSVKMSPTASQYISFILRQQFQQQINDWLGLLSPYSARTRPNPLGRTEAAAAHFAGAGEQKQQKHGCQRCVMDSCRGSEVHWAWTCSQQTELGSPGARWSARGLLPRFSIKLRCGIGLSPPPLVLHGLIVVLGTVITPEAMD